MMKVGTGQFMVVKTPDEIMSETYVLFCAGRLPRLQHQVCHDGHGHTGLVESTLDYIVYSSVMHGEL